MAHADFTKKATMLSWIHQFLSLLHLQLQSGSHTSHMTLLTQSAFCLVPRFRSGLLQIEGAVHLSRLAGLCFFFNFFNISHRSGSINIKPDALSCQFSENASQLDPEQILPASCTVGALTWDLEETIQGALSDDPD